ncbi:hypothetical protein ILYODFUR_022718 [Ilyodon furcidens]|uniref:Uncharacterized protein n=1 Tax=Ilyodon furcidens TaxID=33524 RepID=A0ABV0TXF2_9TELE
MKSDPNPTRTLTLNEPQRELPHRATTAQDTGIEHMPPNPNGINPLPTAPGHTPTGELHPRKTNEATPTVTMWFLDRTKVQTRARQDHLCNSKIYLQGQKT